MIQPTVGLQAEFYAKLDYFGPYILISIESKELMRLIGGSKTKWNYINTKSSPILEVCGKLAGRYSGQSSLGRRWGFGGEAPKKRFEKVFRYFSYVTKMRTIGFS